MAKLIRDDCIKFYNEKTANQIAQEIKEELEGRGMPRTLWLDPSWWADFWQKRGVK